MLFMAVAANGDFKMASENINAEFLQAKTTQVQSSG